MKAAGPFDALMRPPKLRPGEFVPDEEARRQKADREKLYRARHIKKAIVRLSSRYPAVQNPWGLAASHCEALRLLTIHNSQVEIAGILGVSVKTVNAFLSLARERMDGMSTARMVLEYDRQVLRKIKENEDVGDDDQQTVQPA